MVTVKEVLDAALIEVDTSGVMEGYLKEDFDYYIESYNFNSLSVKLQNKMYQAYERIN